MRAVGALSVMFGCLVAAAPACIEGTTPDCGPASECAPGTAVDAGVSDAARSEAAADSGSFADAPAGEAGRGDASPE